MKDFIRNKIVDLGMIHVLFTFPIIISVVCEYLTGQSFADYSGMNDMTPVLVPFVYGIPYMAAAFGLIHLLERITD